MAHPCAECGHANREGARFCAQCGAVLERRCATCGAALDLDARFCDACGAAVAPPPSPEAETRKVLTVVFADLVGSTTLQEELDAESARRVMTRFYEQMRRVLEAHGGVLEKFIGDAVVAVFGRPAVREDDALRAVRAAAAMVVALDSLNDELERVWGVRLRMRTGVNTGELVVSDVGALVGDTMNTAARLEQAAPEGEVLLGAETWRLVHHEIELEPLEPIFVKGKSAPLRAWRVSSVPMVDRRRTTAVEVPLVGREHELDRLRAGLDRVVVERECRLVSVIGSPGVGKSRLAREFGDAVAESATVIEGHCEPSGEGITFLPVAEILRAAAGIGEADTAELVMGKLAALVPRDDPDRDRLVERTAGVLGVVEPASAQETFWALRRGVEFLARERPLVLVLDDLHWGQPMLLDLIEHLVEWVQDAPVLLVALARPELRDAREALAAAGRRALDVVDLEPLDERESLELVDGLLGEVRVPPALRSRILEVTEGNPLFLGETLRMLIDEGALRRDGEAWVVAEDGADIEVPPTIQALLAARIERLRGEERSVVERASVIGKQFYRGAVAELLAPPVANNIDAHLEALRRKDMVEPEGTYWIDEPVYRFHHVLIRDAAYRSLLKEARSELHERYAGWLHAKAGELVGEQEEVIAFHLEQAHEYRRELGPLDEHGRALGSRAAERLWSAGRRALAREDLAAAANLLGRALAREAGDEQAILWDLCDAALSAGDTTAARGLVERYGAEAGGPDDHGARAAVLRGQLANLTGAPDVAATASALAAAATALAAAGDGEGEARAHQVAAGAHARRGQVAAVEEALDRALAAARSAGDRRRTTAVLAAAPRAALWGPSPVIRASGRCLDVVRILRMTPGNRHVEAIALRCQAVLEAMRGRHDAAREILAAGRATLEELGLAFELSETAVHAGIVELLAGDAAAAVEHLRAARAGFEALGAASGAAQAAALLARALVAQGDPRSVEEALEQTEFAQANSGEDLKTMIVACSARAQALARTGETDEGLVWARRAVALAEPTDALADKADAAMALVDVLRATGQDDEAAAPLRSAAEWYAAKGHSVGAARAEASIGATTIGPEARAAPAAVRQTGSGDRPPERFYARFKDHFDAHDVDALVSLYPEDCRFVDHRSVGVLGDVRGREGMAELHASVFDQAPTIRFEIDEVLACDERVIAIQVAYRGSGIRAGEYEDRGGYVTVIEPDGSLHTDEYDYDDTRAMIARYAELGGGLGRLGDRPPERWMKGLAAATARQDPGLLRSLYAEDYRFADHRQLGWASTTAVPDALERIESTWTGTTDLHLEVQEVLACDERTIAARITWQGRAVGDAGGGRFDFPLHVVVRLAGERAVSYDQYEPEDSEAALGRFAELTAGSPPLGDDPLGQFWAEWQHRLNSRDYQGMEELVAPELAWDDHRSLGWEEAHGRAQWMAIVRSMMDASPHAHMDFDEVLACDERVMVMRLAWRGRGVKAGEWEVAAGAVTVVEDGQWVSVDFFEPGDRPAMIARYAELGGGLGRLGELAPARWCRRLGVVVAHRDAESLPALFDEDYESIDHRRVGWEQVHGRAAVVERYQAIWDGAEHMRMEVDEVLACDERLIALRLTWHGLGAAESGGGRFSFPVCVVVVVDSGRGVRWEQYEAEAGEAALARYAELGGRRQVLGDRAPERFYAEWIRRWDASETETFDELYTPDWTLVEHRRLASMEETLGAEGRRALFASIRDAAPDARFEVDEVLACDARVIALLGAWRGSGRDGGGRFEVGLGIVAVMEDGRQSRLEVFEPDDRTSAMARFSELAAQPPAERELPTSERMAREFARHYNARELESMIALHSEAFTMVDHRAIGWDPIQGREGLGEQILTGLAVVTDLRYEVRQVLAADEHVIALQVAWCGRASDGGGEAELLIGVVSVNDGELTTATEYFEPEDLVGMMSRYAELGGGLGELGDRPPERWWAALARCFAARKLELLPELLPEPPRFVDHRTLGWEVTGTRQGPAAVFEAVWSQTAETHLQIDRVLACDERVIALQANWAGTALDGMGEFSIPLAIVTVIEHGHVVQWEQFEPEAGEAARVRFAELSGGAGRGQAECHPPARSAPERAGDPASWLARHDRAGEDGEALAALIDSGVVVRDRRGFPTSDEVGRDAYRSLVAPGAGTELIETQGDLLVCRRDDDPPLWLVLELRDGRLVEAIGLRDEARARAWLSALGVWRAYEAASRAGDIEGLLAHEHPDARLVDHRPLQFQDAENREGIRAIYAGFSELLPGASATVEVLDVHPDATVVSIRWRGVDRDGGGPVEWLTYHASRLRDGVYLESHTFSDPDSALEQLEELSPAAARTRIPRLYVEAINAEDFAALERLYTEDCVLVDHRALGWKDVSSRAALVASYRSWKQNQLGEVTVRGELLEDAGGIFFRQCFTGAWQGGAWEIVTETLNSLRAGRISRVETFGPDQADTRRARARELRAHESG